MARHRSLGGLRRVAMVLALFGGGWGAGITPVAAQTGPLIDMTKKVCAASDLPPNPTPAQIANCSSSTAAIGETVYYVLNAINVSPEGQNITLTDPLPAGFVQIAGAQCLGVAVSSVPPVVAVGALPVGQSATCIIPGYFTASETLTNTASFQATGQQSGQMVEGGDSALLFVDPDLPLPGNLKIEKTANKTVESLNGGPITVTYTIRVTNTGAGDLYTGGYLQVVDNLAALPSSGLGFFFAVDNIACTPGAGTPLCPTYQTGSTSGNTTNQSNGVELGVWEYNPGEAGLIPAGKSFTITFDVTYEGPEGCLYPNTLNGLRNTAFLRFANGQGAFSDMDPGDNTSFTDIEITDHGIVDDCAVRPPEELTIEKTQKFPSGGIIPWGTPVEYRIVVSNPVGIGQTGLGVGPTITNIAVTDLLAALPGMPNIEVTTTSIACLTDPANCVIPSASFTTTINQLSVQVPVASLTVLSLADGASEEISVILSFKRLSCVSYTSAGLRQTANFGKITYQIQTPIKNGFIASQHSGTTGPVITDHDEVPACTLKVQKTGPDQILFGQPFSYHVTYENYGPDPIDIGTLLDAIAIDLPNYASSLTGTYNYACSVNAGPFPANLFQTITTSPTISIGFNAPPSQGTRLLQTTAPNVPVVLNGNSVLSCTFDLTLNQPAADNPFCMGAGDPRLVNAALMDVSHYFNTNVPVPPQAYATSSASLPLCRKVSVTKVMSPKVVAPGGLATVTLTFHNRSDDPITGASLSDTLNPQMSFNNLLSCTNCAPGQPVASASSVSATFGTIPAHGTGTVSFEVKVNGPAPSIVSNIVLGTYEPPPGNWYDQSPALTDDDLIGVFDLFPVQISKTIISTAPGQPPAGPFLFDVTCSLAFGGSPFSFAGQASITLPNATVQVINPATNLPLMVPAGAVCTFQETGLPAATGAYGFSAVGYSPAVPNGSQGQLTVVAGDRNEGMVENCHGPRTANPLQVVHDIGGDCPPVVIPPDRGLLVSKQVVNNAPGSVAGLAFAVSVSCSNSPGTAATDSLEDGETKPFSPYAPNTTCTVDEGDIPFVDACGPNMLPVWTESYAPSHVVTLAPTGTLVTITNTLDCTPVTNGRLTIVKKLDTSAAPGANVAGLTFPVSVDCGGAVQTGSISATAPWDMGNLSTTTPCMVTETAAALPTANICPPGQDASWSVGYVPANQTATPAVTGAEVTVVNSLTCTPQPPPVRQILVTKGVVNNAPGSVAGLVFPITSTCGPNTSGSHSPVTVGHVDGQTTIFGGVEGDTCTITEGAYPATTACNGGTPVWTTAITPSPTLTVAAGTPPVTVTNTLNCQSTFALQIRKVCDPANRIPVGPGRFRQPCTITVTSTGGPVPATIVVNDALSGFVAPGSVISAGPGSPWFCSGIGSANASCSMPGSSFAGSATLTLAADFTAPLPPINKVLRNCASVEGRGAGGAALTPPAKAGPSCAELARSKPIVIGGGLTGNTTALSAIPVFSLIKTCLPAVPLAGATTAQAICTITVTQTGGTPVNQIALTETLMSGAAGAQIVSLTSPQGWIIPAAPFAANAPVSMQLSGGSLTGTPPQSVITAVVQFPNAAAATGAQNCVSVQGLDAAGGELAATGPVCAALQNGAATVVPDPDGDGPALELTHDLAGPCRDDREKQSYTCVFTLRVTNASGKDFVGPEVITQSYGDIRPVEATGLGEGWSCSTLDQTATCVNGEVALVAGGTTGVTMTFLLPAQRDGGQFTNCARLGVPDDSRARVLLAQQAALAFGHDLGTADGEMGPRTRTAISRMQEHLGVAVTAEPDNALFVALGLRLDKGIAPLCVTADLPPMAAPKCRTGEEFVTGTGCQPVRKAPVPEKPAKADPDPVKTPLQCDPETTILRNNTCRCRKAGTVKLTETTCG